jgi:hypothetical protein
MMGIKSFYNVLLYILDKYCGYMVRSAADLKKNTYILQCNGSRKYVYFIIQSLRV